MKGSESTFELRRVVVSLYFNSSHRLRLMEGIILLAHLMEPCSRQLLDLGRSSEVGRVGRWVEERSCWSCRMRGSGIFMKELDQSELDIKGYKVDFWWQTIRTQVHRQASDSQNHVQGRSD